MSRTGWLIVGITLGLLAFMLLNGLAWRHARSMMIFAPEGSRTQSPEELKGWAKVNVLLNGVHLPRPESPLTPTALAPDAVECSIPVDKAITLCAWHLDRGPHSPLVILFHGYTMEKSLLLTEAHAFIEMGASALLVDFRGSGGSSEAYTSLGVVESEDVAAVMRYAKQHFTNRRIILFGQSMGSAAILRAISVQGIAPDGIILESVFDSMLVTIRNRFRAMNIPSFPAAECLVFWGGRLWGFNGFAHNPVDYAGSVKIPTLMMHGEDDPRARISEGRRVYEALAGPKEFKVFPQTGHGSYVSSHPADWKRTVEAWMHGPLLN